MASPARTTAHIAPVEDSEESVVETSVVESAQESSSETAARPEELRLLEALLFASTEPLEESALAKRMPDGVDVKAALAQLQADYAMRGVNLVRVASKWTFRTAGDLSWLMTRESTETRRLSRVAYGQLDFAATVDAFNKLMGKGEAASRRELMELHGDAVEIDI